MDLKKGEGMGLEQRQQDPLEAWAGGRLLLDAQILATGLSALVGISSL